MDVTIDLRRDELECVVDVLFVEAYRRRRHGDEVPEAMLRTMRRLNSAMENTEEPRRFARWLDSTVGPRP